jgi:hypothetical protein
MNIKNAFGFLVLGMVMYASPALAQSTDSLQIAVADSSVRTLWLEFMGWVIGGIGLSSLGREAAVRLPVLLTMLVPAQLLRPVEGRGEPMRLPVGVRVVVSN